MTDETTSDVVAARVREARKARGWLAGDLAGICARAGHPEITENVIENIESGRRKGGRRTRAVTVDELVVLADVLGFSPADVLGGLPPGTIGGVTVDEIERIAEGLKATASVLRWREENEGES
jgi:transcriptional regulator with XRE-family HTH domain